MAFNEKMRGMWFLVTCINCNQKVVAKGLCKKHYMEKWYNRTIKKPREEYAKKLIEDFPKDEKEIKIKIKKSKIIKKKSSMMICENCGKKCYRSSYNQKYCKNCRMY